MLSRKFCTAQHVDLKSSLCCIFPSGPLFGGALAYVTTIQWGTLVHDTNDPPTPMLILESPPAAVVVSPLFRLLRNSSLKSEILPTVSFPSLMKRHGSVPLRLGAAMAHSSARRSTPSSTSVASNLCTERRDCTKFWKVADTCCAASTLSAYHGRNSSSVMCPSSSSSRYLKRASLSSTLASTSNAWSMLYKSPFSIAAFSKTVVTQSSLSDESKSVESKSSVDLICFA
mmetsp:Transcript_33795/g.62104  ORF Transcript_33795/g.62104 Transcript_33795/m.62104 type:complete len:229 (-) Transcript_33795:547-1233(-)